MEPSSSSQRKPFRMPISDATTNILLAISQKMDCKTFNRLRRTSRQLRDFVEEHIEEYDIHVDKVLNTGRVDGTDGFLFQLDDTPFYGVQSKCPVVWPAASFQGFHFNEVVIFCHSFDKSMLTKTLNAITSDRLCISQYNDNLQSVSASRPYTSLKVCCTQQEHQIDLNKFPDFKTESCRDEIFLLSNKVVLNFPIPPDDQTLSNLIRNVWRGEDVGLLKSITICDNIFFEVDSLIQRYFPVTVVWDPRQIDLESKPFEWDDFGEACFEYYESLRVIVFETSTRIILITVVEFERVTVDIFDAENYDELTDELTNKFVKFNFAAKKEGVRAVVKSYWDRHDNGNTIFDKLALL